MRHSRILKNIHIFIGRL